MSQNKPDLDFHKNCFLISVQNDYRIHVFMLVLVNYPNIVWYRGVGINFLFGSCNFAKLTMHQSNTSYPAYTHKTHISTAGHLHRFSLFLKNTLGQLSEPHKESKQVLLESSKKNWKKICEKWTVNIDTRNTRHFWGQIFSVVFRADFLRSFVVYSCKMHVKVMHI